jgi:transglutaminase-like putative cysteine protease
MLIKIGFDIAYTAPQPTPMVVMLSVHPSRVADLLAPENIVCDPPTPIHYYHDGFGNWCGRLVIPSGRSVLSNRATVRDSGLLDTEMPTAEQIPVENLPDDVILFLLPSRYCEIDRMMDLAWSLFKDAPTGWGRLRAICDYVHNHVTFGYQFAAATKSAHDVHAERRGVCRAIAPVTSATSVFRPTTRRWISAPGSKSTCPAAGSPPMPATTSRASGAS